MPTVTKQRTMPFAEFELGIVEIDPTVLALIPEESVMAELARHQACVWDEQEANEIALAFGGPLRSTVTHNGITAAITTNRMRTRTQIVLESRAPLGAE